MERDRREGTRRKEEDNGRVDEEGTGEGGGS